MSGILSAIDHLPLAEPCGQVLTCYADAIGKVEILEPGVNVRITYVEVRAIGGLRYRVPVLEVIHPLISFVPSHTELLLNKARQERDYFAAMSAQH